MEITDPTASNSNFLSEFIVDLEYSKDKTKISMKQEIPKMSSLEDWKIPKNIHSNSINVYLDKNKQKINDKILNTK